MYTTPKEIPEGYCQITCGRCACCSPLADVLKREGLNEFAWALSLAGLGGDAAEPGWMMVALAPTDGALRSFLAAKGWASREAVEADASAKAYVAELARAHLLPPLPDTRAVWTTPFFLPGTEAATLQGRKVRVAARDGDTPTLAGASGAQARVTKADVYACKGYVNVLDGVLAHA